MIDIKKKVIEIGLKNAIIIRTNIDPFKINDPDMEQVRGVWRCDKKRAEQIDYFIGAVRLMPGKAKILGVWEIKEDGTIRLISEAEQPKEKRRSDRNAGTKKRNRIK